MEKRGKKGVSLTDGFSVWGCGCGGAQDGVEQEQQRGRVGHGHVLRQELGGHSPPRRLAQHLPESESSRRSRSKRRSMTKRRDKSKN